MFNATPDTAPASEARKTAPMHGRGLMTVGTELLSPPAPLFVPLTGLADCEVHLKIEGVNAAGSIKLKTAIQLVDDMMSSGRVQPDTEFIESSSGNLGVALSMVCANRGHRFTCITDPNASRHAIQVMRSLGARVIAVDEKDESGGYLGTRIALVQKMVASNMHLIWLNQYANASNWRAHYLWTAPEIADRFRDLDYLFIGAGTTGTLMGCARYFREHSPRTRIIAVDAVGSVTFDAPPARRRIPGLGTSRKPEICDPSLVDDVIHVPEVQTIRMCRELAACGALVGGSTGTVLSAVRQSSFQLRSHHRVVALSPDMGDKYVDTIYADDWVREHFPSVGNSNDLNREAA